jgi:hypothetical protein
MDLYLIVAPHFCAAFAAESSSNVIVTTAPILAWAKGKNVAPIIVYCAKKGWQIECIKKGG